jgi:RNA polymerase sigma-70 factor (ECF subfamily)
MAAIAFDPPSDEDLVAAWQRGEEQAAAALVNRHAVPLGRYLVAHGAASGEIDDLLQDAFFKAFRSLGQWRGSGSFRGWLFRIGANVLRDRFRKGKGRIVLSLEGHDATDSSDPAGELAATELERRTRDGLARLPRLQREVFLLRVQQGLDYAEVAAAVGSTPGAARVHYHHAVRRMKEWLQ